MLHGFRQTGRCSLAALCTPVYPLVTGDKPRPAAPVDCVMRIPTAEIAAFLEAMHQALAAADTTDGVIGVAGRLDRNKLDFTLDSLHEIDDYLRAVHASLETVVGFPLLSTVWSIAMYVGEVIRREAPGKCFEWVTIGEPSSHSGDTSIEYPDLGVVRALRARNGELCLPSRVVLRVILRGSNARTVYSFAGAAAVRADGAAHTHRPT